MNKFINHLHKLVLRIGTTRLLPHKADVFRRGWHVRIIVPKGTRDHEVGTVTVAGNGHVVHTTLAEEHLDVRLMRLGIEVVNEEDGEVDLLANNHRSNLGITTEGTRMHAGNRYVNSSFSKGLLNESASCSRTDEFVMSEGVGVVETPLDHIYFAVVVRHDGNSQLFAGHFFIA